MTSTKPRHQIDVIKPFQFQVASLLWWIPGCILGMFYQIRPL